MYTDGSKSKVRVGAVVVSQRQSNKITLPAMASIFTAELHALRLALWLIISLDIRRTVVCTDSLSAVKTIMDVTTQNHLVQRIQQTIHQITLSGKEVTLLWMGHSGITGNDRAEGEAKSAATLDPQFIHIPYTDWYRKIRQTTYDKWREEWRGTSQQLRQIKEDPERWIRSRVTRREEIILIRLITSHTRLTHEYIMQGVW